MGRTHPERSLLTEIDVLKNLRRDYAKYKGCARKEEVAAMQSMIDRQVERIIEIKEELC